jgi:hypothetical protein
MNPFDPFSESEIKQIEDIRAESIGWTPLAPGAYFHASSEAKMDRVIITGLADAGLDHENVLLLI